VLASTTSPNGVCRTTCNAAPTPNPTRACASGYCYDESIGPATDYYCTTYTEFCNSLQAARIGVCETALQPGGRAGGLLGQGRPGRHLDLQPYNFATGAGYCLAVFPGSPTTEGATCTYPVANASGCGLNMTCYYAASTDTSGTCQTWCKYSGGSCPSGSGESCLGDGVTGDKVGLCY